MTKSNKIQFINEQFDIIYEAINDEVKITKPKLFLFSTKKEMKQFYMKNYDRKIDEDLGVAASFDTINKWMLFYLNSKAHKTEDGIITSLLHEYWHHVELLIPQQLYYAHKLSNNPPVETYFRTKSYFINQKGNNPAKINGLLQYIYQPDELPAYLFAEAVKGSEIQYIASQYIKNNFKVDTNNIKQKIEAQREL